ncbi:MULTISPECIES: helix-turn-helix transcriptional regulator [Frankia]|uniref:Transcriptional regulator n=1 Tax=Frankia alni (strain DSM 45986 / CECT 9034 / ACN14a) TaxID=326424 RepID=Q0RT86_FRAAA|nr:MULTISPECIES: WYL domain-containing protein [Frankia]CAJ59215.1 putative transcriptional regulator [Frankia alni ACN14a]
MTRTDRLYALMEELRAVAPRPVTVPVLARRLEVSERTVQRDLKALAETGAPVYSATGRGGGWSVDPAMTLPPIGFTPGEALAVAAALAAAEGSAPFADGIRGAMRKIAASLSGQALVEAHELAAQIVALPSRLDPTVRGAVEWALTRREVLSLSYLDAGGRTSEREVEPAGLLAAEGRWYLVAWCRLRRAPRGFRLDRIRAAAPTGQAAPRRELADLLGSAATGAVTPAVLDSLAP